MVLLVSGGSLVSLRNKPFRNLLGGFVVVSGGSAGFGWSLLLVSTNINIIIKEIRDIQTQAYKYKEGKTNNR